MITLYDRHIARIITAHIIIVLIFLLGIDFLVQSAEESDNIGRGNYHFWLMLSILLLNVPARIVEFMPAAVLVGTITALGQLNKQQELTVIRTSGISRLRLSLSGLMIAFFLGCTLIALAEYGVAPAQNRAQWLHHHALNTTAPQTDHGIWLRDGDNIVYIGAFQADGSLEKIRFYRPHEHDIEIQESQRATFMQTHWQLDDNRALRIGSQSSMPITPTTHWQNRILPATIAQLMQLKNAYTLRELYTITGFLRAHQLNDQQMSLKLWQRIFLPITTITMVILALPCVFNTRRDGNGARLVIGILLGASYYVVQGIVTKLGLLLHWSTALSALLPILIFALPPLFLLTRD